MRKAIIAAIVASALFAVGALAANLTIQSEDVASGTAVVGACADRVEIQYDTSDTVDSTGDYVITQATVRFYADFTVDSGTAENDATDCRGAAVDVAIQSGGWYNSDGCVAEERSPDGPVTAICNFPEGQQAPVNGTSNVRVLANGNVIPNPPVAG